MGLGAVAAEPSAPRAMRERGSIPRGTRRSHNVPVLQPSAAPGAGGKAATSGPYLLRETRLQRNASTNEGRDLAPRSPGGSRDGSGKETIPSFQRRGRWCRGRSSPPRCRLPS